MSVMVNQISVGDIVGDAQVCNVNHHDGDIDVSNVNNHDDNIASQCGLVGIESQTQFTELKEVSSVKSPAMVVYSLETISSDLEKKINIQGSHCNMIEQHTTEKLSQIVTEFARRFYKLVAEIDKSLINEKMFIEEVDNLIVYFQMDCRRLHMSDAFGLLLQQVIKTTPSIIIQEEFNKKEDYVIFDDDEILASLTVLLTNWSYNSYDEAKNITTKFLLSSCKWSTMIKQQHINDYSKPYTCTMSYLDFIKLRVTEIKLNQQLRLIEKISSLLLSHLKQFKETIDQMCDIASIVSVGYITEMEAWKLTRAPTDGTGEILVKTTDRQRCFAWMSPPERVPPPAPTQLVVVINYVKFNFDFADFSTNYNSSDFFSYCARMLILLNHDEINIRSAMYVASPNSFPTSNNFIRSKSRLSKLLFDSFQFNYIKFDIQQLIRFGNPLIVDQPSRYVALLIFQWLVFKSNLWMIMFIMRSRICLQQRNENAVFDTGWIAQAGLI